MTDSEAALEEVRRALRREPRVNFDHQPISLTFANGELLLSGEVGDVAAKRLAVERAAGAPSVTAVLDELRVRPAESIPDDEIYDLLRRALVEEPALTGCTIREHIRGQFQIVHAPLTSVGRVDLSARRRGAEPRPETARWCPRLVGSWNSRCDRHPRRPAPRGRQRRCHLRYRAPGARQRSRRPCNRHPGRLAGRCRHLRRHDPGSIGAYGRGT